MPFLEHTLEIPHIGVATHCGNIRQRKRLSGRARTQKLLGTLHASLDKQLSRRDAKLSTQMTVKLSLIHI